jgi:hypothetical protein
MKLFKMIVTLSGNGFVTNSLIESKRRAADRFRRVRVENCDHLVNVGQHRLDSARRE